MARLAAKSLKFNDLTAKLMPSNNLYFLSYYIPVFYKSKLNLLLKKNSSVSIYKRFLKHSKIFSVLKRQFVPGMGVLKFNDLLDLCVFIKQDFRKISDNIPLLFLGNVFFNKFFCTVPIFLAYKEFIKHTYLSVFIFVNFLFLILRTFLINYKFMRIFYNIKNFNALRLINYYAHCEKKKNIKAVVRF